MMEHCNGITQPVEERSPKMEAKVGSIRITHGYQKVNIGSGQHISPCLDTQTMPFAGVKFCWRTAVDFMMFKIQQVRTMSEDDNLQQMNLLNHELLIKICKPG